MFETVLTIGLFDKDAEKQLISRDDACDLISRILIDECNIFAFTMLDCAGVYRMQSTGNIVREPSIRVEIVTDENLDILPAMIARLKSGLNQETIMVKTSRADVDFI
jgi:hypothetical protein